MPVQFRHLQSGLAYLTLTDKAPYLYSRGRGQVRGRVRDVPDRLRRSTGTSSPPPRCYTVINSNWPGQLDIPMCMGLIDFAAAGQLSMITPFTLAGAMAPVTLAGALTLQHAEALAGMALTQAVRPGAPVVYGAFTSNVDMKSGAPAFGTPEYFEASLASGQLAASRRAALPLIRPERLQRRRRAGDVRDDDEPLRRGAGRVQRPPPCVPAGSRAG